MKPIKILLLAATMLMLADFAFAQTWNLAVNIPTNQDASSLVSSADGTKLSAIIQGRNYTSTNSGLTWITNNLPYYVAWIAMASSAEGNKLAVAAYNNGIYASTNSGVVWTQTSAPTNYRVMRKLA